MCGAAGDNRITPTPQNYAQRIGVKNPAIRSSRCVTTSDYARGIASSTLQPVCLRTHCILHGEPQNRLARLIRLPSIQHPARTGVWQLGQRGPPRASARRISRNATTGWAERRARLIFLSAQRTFRPQSDESPACWAEASGRFESRTASTCSSRLIGLVGRSQYVWSPAGS